MLRSMAAYAGLGMPVHADSALFHLFGVCASLNLVQTATLAILRC